MNPFVSILAQMAEQILIAEGPTILKSIEDALNGVVQQHGHSVSITPSSTPPA